MSKAIAITFGESTFLVETDDTVEIPANFKVSATKTMRRIPDGAEEVVSVKEIQKSLAGVKDVIIACCQQVFDAIESIPKPDKFSVELGIKLAGEAGIPMVTKASEEANFKITVEWTKP